MTDTEKAARFLVDFSGPITLEVESAQKRTTSFAQDYSRWIGKEVTWQELESGGHALNMGEGKWGPEPRIYFPKVESVKNQLEECDFHVENGDVRISDTYRVNSTVLFEELVRVHGFRLGENT